MSYTVDAVSQAISLLFLVAKERDLGVTELAKRSGNTKARTFRLLATLEEGGLVQRKMPLATYSLGHGALMLGTAAQGQLSLLDVAGELLEQVGKECNESVLIRIRDGLETVCIAWWDAPHTVRIHSQLSDRRSLKAGASGKLLLAHAPDDVRRLVLAEQLDQYTENTIVDGAGLARELEKILEQGVSISVAERTVGTLALAAPIRDASGAVVASLSMTAPTTRVDPARLAPYLAIIRAGAARFSQALGHA